MIIGIHMAHQMTHIMVIGHNIPMMIVLLITWEQINIRILAIPMELQPFTITQMGHLYMIIPSVNQLRKMELMVYENSLSPEDMQFNIVVVNIKIILNIFMVTMETQLDLHIINSKQR